MGQPERRLTTLGQRVAALQDGAPEARLERERGRARLLAAAPRPPSPGLRPAFAPAASLAALLLVALSLVLVVRPRAPMRFDLGAAEPGVVGDWIAAPPAGARPIRFSDGSSLRLAPGGRARVTAVDADGARISLEEGALEVSVVHRDHARWTVSVGPFQVHVIGTRFDLRWDASAERFEVTLHEGAVTLSGPVVGDARAVRAGERITISARDRLLQVGSLDGASATVPPTAEPPAPAAPPAPAPPTPASPSRKPPSAPTASAPAPEAPEAPEAGPPAPVTTPEPPGPSAPPGALGWRALALNARYQEALAAAERSGFDGVCASASAADLQALGYAARLGGSPARAVQALSTLRRRFPGGPEAGAAAFMLGRIAQDQSKDPAGAAAWLTSYLREQPGGAFAAEALGRLVEATDKAGDEAGARLAATRYLTIYPDGPYAEYAKLLLARRAAGAEPSPSSP